MKSYSFTFLSGIAATCFLLASCSSIKQNNVFLKRKYFDFRRQDKQFALNKSTPSNILLTARTPGAPPTITVKSVSILRHPSIPIPVVASSNIIDNRMKSLTNQSTSKLNTCNNLTLSTHFPSQLKIEKCLPISKPEGSDRTSDNSISATDPVILIILAVLISPLAVYLYDRATTSRFWLDLILWILGVGFGFGILYFFGLLLLAAIIYAILIVTGNLK